MKKNLMSVFILALLIVNIVLTAVMLISVMGTNQKTAALITDIGLAMSLELTGPANEEPEEPIISAIDLVEVPLENKLTILLKAPDSGEVDANGNPIAATPQYLTFYATIMLYTKAEGYKKIDETTISSRTNMISNVISGIVTARTKDECVADVNLANLKESILQELREQFGDTDNTIYDIALTQVAYGS
ncbi:MAG: hypothetical protein LBM69_03075 [Lachnospiraceae bacterium]|jgi:flagellar FliL protein|nr:hypothetical protein [Lachnospiraceae bacterium]